MNKITFSLLSVAALTSISSLVLASKHVTFKQDHEERKALASTSNVEKQIKYKPKRLVKVWVESECWYVLLDSKLERFAETELSVVVPYVLQRMPSESRLCVDDKSYRRPYRSFGPSDKLYHQWIKEGNLLIYNRWTEGMVQKLHDGKNYQCKNGCIEPMKSEIILQLERESWVDGEIKTRNGKDYQCRQGRIVCQDDPEVVNGQSLFQYSLAGANWAVFNLLWEMIPRL